MDQTPEDVLAREVYAGESYKRFGELTAEDALRMADQLSGLRGGGLEAKVAPVGRAWRELADLMDRRSIDTVADLEPEEAEGFAERLRVVPPGGSWLA